MRSGSPGGNFLDAARLDAEAATGGLRGGHMAHCRQRRTAKALAASRKQSNMSALMTQLTPEQNDLKAPPCQRGIVIELSWLGCGWLEGELCSAKLC
eukprot:365267-Chlamydomonas_euryale.AAC.1